MEQYFAKKPSSEIGSEIKDRIDQFYVFMNQSGIFRRMWKSMAHYYGVSPTTNASTDGIRPGGRNSQLSMMKVNHFRNLGSHLIQLIMSQRIKPQPVAINSDAKSQRQTTIAAGVIDYYSREKRIDRKLREAVEAAVICGDGFVQTTFSPSGGDFGDEEISVINDISIRALPSSEVIRDPNKSNFEQLDWVVTREWHDRFYVADRYAPEPEAEVDGEDETEAGSELNSIRERILSQPTKIQYDRTKMPMINWLFSSEMFMESDDIALYHFWHKRTPSLPRGRYVICLDDGTVLYDGPLPYKSIPVRRITTGDLQGTSFGYTPLFDLIVIQEAIDALYSAVATNQLSFGVQLIMAMKGSDIDYKQLSQGLAFIEYADPNGKPEPLNLTHTPQEVFAFIGQLEGVMETISGINSVVRGDPPDSLKSGSALALVQAQAINYATPLQHSYVNLNEDVYTDILGILKDHADTKETITIVGKFNRSMLMDFTKDDLDNISRVQITPQPASEQNEAGRLTMAQDLIQSGILKTPEEYLSVVKTGNVDPLLEGDHAEMILIRSENENMSAGQNASVLITDDHSLHVREHRTILASPEARENPQLLANVTSHMAEHVKYLADPSLAPFLTVLGQTPLATALAPEVGQGYQEGPAAKAPKQAQNNDAGPADGPSMPKNPATGETWNPTDGGQPDLPTA